MSAVKSSTRHMMRGIVCSAAVLIPAVSAFAQSATLAWDRAASHTNLNAFILKYGTTSGSYTGQVSVATNVTTATVNNLVPGRTYFFVVTARNVSNLESDPSNEVSYNVPGTGNTAPVANNGSISTPEDQSRSITLAGSDANGDSLTFAVLTSPANGSLSGNAPNLTYTPNANFFGSDSFTFRANDGTTNSAPATISITVTAVNDQPTLNSISNVTISEDASLQTVSLSGITSGAANENQTLTVTATSSNTGLIPNPTVNYSSPNTTGNLTFRPTTNASGTATITVTVNDGQNANNTFSRTFTVTVNPVNDAPTISSIANQTINQSASTATLSFTVGDVETSASSLTVARASSNTTLVPTANIVLGGSGANRTVRVTPVSTLNGSAVITVTVTDATGASASETFTVTVTPVNQAPTLNSLSPVTINEDAPLQTISLAGITSGATNENQTLTVNATSSNTSLIPNPTVNYNSPNATGTLTFRPGTNASGTVTITVTVNDGQSANNTFSRTFTVMVNPVNDSPTISDIANQTVNESTATATLSFTVGDVETSASSLTVTRSSSNTTLVPTANIVLGGSGANRTVRVTPVSTLNGSAVITVTVTDAGGASASETFTVTVTPVNQAPTLNSLSNLTISEDAPQQTVNLAGISTGAANENDTLTITAISSNPGVIPNPSVAYTSPNATGSISFTPVADASGTATITVTVNDGQSQNNTTTRSFNVTVNAVNDAPTLNSLSNLTINEDAPQQTVNLSGIASGAANETQTLSVSATSSNPSLIPNPTISYTSPGTTGILTFKSATNASGSTVISVTVNDGQSQNNTIIRTFTVNVFEMNDTPTISSIADRNVNENTPTGIVPFTVGDVETPAASLVASASSANTTLVPNSNITLGGAGASRTINITPVTDRSGSAVITILVTDASGGNSTTTFTVYVNSVNQPPTLDAISNIAINEDANPQTVTLAGISTGAFDELQTLTITATSSAPSLIPHPTVNYTSPNFSGTLEFASLANANGTATITVAVNDGQTENSTTTRTFTVTVNPVNDSPTISAISNQSIDQNTSTSAIGFTIGDQESPISSLVLAVSSSDQILVPNPNIVLGGSGANRTVRITPVQGEFGSTIITLTVADDTGGINSHAFVLTVNAVNYPPTLGTLTDLTIVEDSGNQTVTLTGISSGSSEEIQTLTVSAVSSNPALVPHPTINYSSPAGSGSLNFTPNTNGFGVAVITVTVSDGQAQNSSVSQSFAVTVNAANDAPTLNPIGNLSLSENASLQSIALTGIGSGAANEIQALTISAVSSNPSLIPNPTVNYFNPNSSGTLTFTPAANVSGTATITVSVDDGQSQNNSIVRTFTVTVSGANSAPTITDIADRSISMNGIVASMPFVIGDAETPPENLTVRVTSSNQLLVWTNNITFNGSGSNRTVSITTTTGRHGYTIITFTVVDPQGASTSDSFVLTVVPPNIQPTLDTIPSRIIDEDSGPHVINLTGISAGGPEEVQDLIVSAVSADPSIIPHPTIDYSSPNSTGTLTFSPGTNIVGSATIIVTVNDGQSLDYRIIRTFGVTITGVNDAPTISTIPNQVVDQNTSTPTIPFIVGDLEVPADNISAVASSSDQILVPNGNIVLGGSGANRTITVAPAALRSGTATITIFISDGSLSASTSFQITVGSGNTPPALAAPASLSIDSYSEIDIPIVITDLESRPEDLVLTASSYNPGVLPDTSITFSGSGSNRFVKCKPVDGKSGNVSINLGVSDGQAITRRTLQLSVQAGTAPTARISVRRNGLGTVKPALDGQMLTIGKTYTIAAVPAEDEVFKQWTIPTVAAVGEGVAQSNSGVTSAVPALTFVMASNLVLEVTFIKNPFRVMRGAYNGLFNEVTEVRQDSSGSFALTPTDRGTYSGKLQLGSSRYSISGVLDLERKATNTIVRKGMSSLVVEMDFEAITNQVVGRVTDGDWEAPLLGDRALYNSKTNPCPYNGNYTLVLPGQLDPNDGPEGDSYGTIKVDANGLIKFAGILADGTKMSLKAPLSMTGQLPIYVPLYKGGGSVLSWMTFTNRPTDDLTGLMSWIKPAQMKSKHHADGFTNEAVAIGSSFIRPTSSTESVINLTDTEVVFSGGDLTADFSNAISITANKVTNLADNKLSLSIKTANGQFKGSVVDPSTGKSLKFGGVILQKQNIGSGFLLGKDLSSRVALGE